MTDKNQNSVWVYEKACPYTAPVTSSEMDKKKDRKKHEEFVDIMREALRFRMLEHPDNAMIGHIFKENCISYDKKLTTSSLRYDLRYDDKHIIVLGEVKVTKQDLKKSHTVTQLRAYLDELALPVNHHKDKYLCICTPHNIGAIARTIVEEEVMPHCPANLDGVKVIYMSEYDGKTIPAPDGWEDQDFTQEYDHAVWSKKYGTVPVKVRWVPVSNLFFDEQNSRLYGIENTQYNQAQCKAKLLADGDCADTKSAIHRRAQMFIGSIREPIWITSDMTVYVGNSRTAYAQYACEITNHHAPGYEMLLAYDFGDADPNMLYDMKQEEQAMTKLDQGIRHDAMDMWRRHVLNKQSIQELHDDVFNGKYSNEIIEGSIDAIEWLMHNKYGSNAKAMELYFVSYALNSIEKNFPKVFITNGCTRQSITAAADQAEDSKWRTLEGIKLIVKAIQDPLLPEWKIEAVKNFVNQASGWASVKEWTEKYNEAAEQNRFPAKLASTRIKSAKTSIENMLREVQHTHEILQSSNRSSEKLTDDEKKTIYSKTAIETLQEEIQELYSLVGDVKNVLGDAVYEHSQYIKNSRNKANTSQSA